MPPDLSTVESLAPLEGGVTPAPPTAMLKTFSLSLLFMLALGLLIAAYASIPT